MPKLKMGQVINKLEDRADEDTRRRENRAFILLVVVAPLILIAAIYAAWYFKAFG